MSICCPRTCRASTLSLLALGKAVGTVGLFLGLSRNKGWVGYFKDPGRRLDIVNIPSGKKVLFHGLQENLESRSGWL